jgi:hypothetical protein
MIKRKVVAATLAAAVLMSPTAALAGDREPVYHIYYYSDASYSQQVGFDQGDCSHYGVLYYHSGQSTAYAVYEHVAYCTDGQWEPL